MFENRRMPNGMSERARSRGHAVWEGVPCKGALYPIQDFVRIQSGVAGSRRAGPEGVRCGILPDAR